MLVILLVEVRGHLAPDFDALDSGQVATVLKINPVGFVQLWANEEVKVINLAILSHKSGC